MSERGQVRSELVERLDRSAVVNPGAARWSVWVWGFLAVLNLVGMVSSLAAQDWGLAASGLAGAAGGGFLWWVWRRAIRRAPQTRQSIDAVPDV